MNVKALEWNERVSMRSIHTILVIDYSSVEIFSIEIVALFEGNLTWTSGLFVIDVIL